MIKEYDAKVLSADEYHIILVIYINDKEIVYRANINDFDFDVYPGTKVIAKREKGRLYICKFELAKQIELTGEQKSLINRICEKFEGRKVKMLDWQKWFMKYGYTDLDEEGSINIHDLYEAFSARLKAQEKYVCLDCDGELQIVTGNKYYCSKCQLYKDIKKTIDYHYINMKEK